MNLKNLTLALTLAAGLVIGAPAAADFTGYVVHGIDGDDFGLDPALPVDVFVSDVGCAIPGFEFGDRVGPLNLPAGTYDIRVSLADSMNPCDGQAVIDLPGVELPDGVNASIVAHRTSDGSAGTGDVLSLGVTASIFNNDFSSTQRGKARILAHHAALAPAVDVVVSRDYDDPSAPGVTVPGLSNPTDPAGALLSQINAQFRPGNWDVTLEVGGAAVFGPTSLRLRPFTTTYVYAVGDFFAGTFQYLVFTEDTNAPPRGSHPRGILRDARLKRF